MRQVLPDTVPAISDNRKISDFGWFFFFFSDRPDKCGDGTKKLIISEENGKN